LKCVIPFGILLLFIQGISESFKSIYAIWRGKWL
jgi:TRAP-type mannitol/chloroaromatic compound transport system permease small subunit